MKISLLERNNFPAVGFYRWYAGLDAAQKIVLTLLYACLTGMLAQFVFYLPASPVPLTGQTFAVFLGALLLGRWGGVAQAVYTVIGVAGIPWFAASKSGLAAILGPTGGYAIGFILAAFVAGWWLEKRFAAVSSAKIFALLLAANIIFIYGLGLAQLNFWLGGSADLGKLLAIGMLPFIVGDALKIMAAVLVAKIFLRQNLNGDGFKTPFVTKWFYSKRAK